VPHKKADDEDSESKSSKRIHRFKPVSLLEPGLAHLAENSAAAN
jgi:hypothetical protein